MASKAKEIDARTGADTSAIEALKDKVKSIAENARIPNLRDLMLIVAVGFDHRYLYRPYGRRFPFGPFLKRTTLGPKITA